MGTRGSVSDLLIAEGDEMMNPNKLGSFKARNKIILEERHHSSQQHRSQHHSAMPNSLMPIIFESIFIAFTTCVMVFIYLKIKIFKYFIIIIAQIQ